MYKSKLGIEKKCYRYVERDDQESSSELTRWSTDGRENEKVHRFFFICLAVRGSHFSTFSDCGDGERTFFQTVSEYTISHLGTHNFSVLHV
jgi:hypothetical protein